MEIEKIQAMIVEECDTIKKILLQKNREYGNSVVDPIRLFSKADPLEQVKVRIDDKLSRINNTGGKTILEDTERDLIGYLILKRICEKYWEKEK